MNWIKHFITSVLLLTNLLPQGYTAPSCKSPPESLLHEQWLDEMRNSNEHESLYLTHPFYSAIESELEKSDSPNEIHLFGNQNSNNCNISHLEEASQNGGKLQDRSYCPWYNIINHSTTRYPQDLAESRCRCKYGIGYGIITACEPVYYNIRVLRRSAECDSEGYYHYYPGWQRLAVGCTMVHAL